MTSYHIITIDTEEDNWKAYARNENSVKNIEKIRYVQDIFHKYNIKPTYLISYPVATDEKSIKIFREFLKEDLCEVGAHVHPWNTPPFGEKINRANSMLCNLPAEVQYNKIKHLHETIQKNIGVIPVSFRSGRFGYSKDVSGNLNRLGYKVDSSITPHINWKRYHGPDFSNVTKVKPYRFSPPQIFVENREGSMMEVPLSVGYIKKYGISQSNIFQNFSDNRKGQKMYNKLLGKLSRYKLVILSPESASLGEMQILLSTMIRDKINLFNMFFHSPSLEQGLTPFAKTGNESKELINRIRKYADYITNVINAESITLSGCYDIIK